MECNGKEILRGAKPSRKFSVLRQTKAEVLEATRRIACVFDDVARVGHPTDGSPIKIGSLRSDVANAYEKQTGVKITGNALYTDAGALLHHRTGIKYARGKVVPVKDLVEMPSRISGMDVYENDDALVFTDYYNKYIVEVNQPIRINRTKTKACCHISSSAVIDKKEFGKYNVIKKK